MNVEFIATSNFGYPPGRPGRGGNAIVAIIDHIAEGTEAGVRSWFRNPGSYASSHYFVCRDGRVLQFVAEENAAWANGALDHPDLSVPWIAECARRNLNPNLVTLSIEHEGYHDRPLSEEQIQASIALHRELIGRHGIPIDGDHITGHFRLDSVNRRNCPGKFFPWERVMQDIATVDPKRQWIEDIYQLAELLRADRPFELGERSRIADELQQRAISLKNSLGFIE